LAERSQGAAKEIGNVATQSVRVAERSGALLQELVPAIRKTADLIQEVATASREQASGVEQINRAMSQVDQVTQRNSSAAEELSSTAEELASQAETLQQLLSFFRIADESQAVSSYRNRQQTQFTAPSRTAPQFNAYSQTPVKTTTNGHHNTQEEFAQF